MTGATRADSVSLTEALERLLPHHEDNSDEVACWLNDQQRRGRIPLLGGGVVTASSANPAMLGIVAHIPPVGRPFLYVQLRQALPGCHLWEPGHTAESLAQHRRFWTFERESFEAHFPGAPRNRSDAASRQGHPDGWAVRLARELMDVAFPHGEWRAMRPVEVRFACTEAARRRGKRLPGRDSFARAMGRRRSRA